MTLRDPAQRRLAAHAARSGFVVSTVAFVVSVFAATASDVVPAAAATAGTAQVITPFEVGVGGSGQPLESGDSATDFSLNLPLGAACTGDTANDAYNVFGYMVAAGIDPATLTFNSNGPTGVSLGDPDTLRAPLYDVDGLPYASAATAPAVDAGDPGTIINIPAFDFATLAPEGDAVLLPPGTYDIGIACWGPVGASPVLDKFWNARVTLVADAADTGPVGITWTAEAAPAETSVVLAADPAGESVEGDEVTLTASVLPADADGTISFKDGEAELGSALEVVDGKATLALDDLEVGDHTLTATFAPGEGSMFASSTSDAVEHTVTEGDGTSTTTTSTGSATSTTVGVSTTTSIPSAVAATSSGSGPATGVGVSALARTGGSLSAVVWGVLLVVFGRMAILLGRPPRVLPAGAS